MPTVHVPGPHAQLARPRRTWLQSPPLWAGVSIVAIWIAVLFVGLFGDDIAGSDGSSVPSVIVVAICAVIATAFVARWGFAQRRDE